MVSLLFQGLIDLFRTCKTKINDSSVREQFIIEGYSTIYRLDRNDRGGVIMLIIKDNLLTSRFDKYCFRNKIEIFCIDLNLRKKKRLIFCCCDPHKRQFKHHLFQIESPINFYFHKYKNWIILGDFNAEISDLSMKSFYTINNFKYIFK